MYRNDRLANSREIPIEVRDNMTNISLELIQENKVSKSLWTLVTNSKKKIAVGVIYAPQENVTPNNELKIMYEDIRTNKNRKRRETTNNNPRKLQCENRSSNKKVTRHRSLKEGDNY